jgi:hypothetical protein
MSRVRAVSRALAIGGVVCAMVGVVLLVSSAGGTAAATPASSDVLGSAFVALAVMALAAGALLRAGRR